MWKMLWPVLVAVGSNAVYNISAKGTPKGINSFASLTVSYFVAMICSTVMFFLTNDEKNFFSELCKSNIATITLGVAIVGLEFGFISMYRAGWKISVAQLVASAAVSVVLLIIGCSVYRDILSVRKIIGMGICAVGLFLITT